MMKTEGVLILLVFWLLVAWTLLDTSRRKKLFSRTRGQWLIDLAGLTMHGMVVPLFQAIVIATTLNHFFPAGFGSLNLPGPISFLVSMVGIDYVYYWNHRLLHHQSLWRFHSVHHSGNTFDVFTTSRNSAITTFLILYVWVNGTFIYLLKDPAPFVWGVILSNILDILRHSGLQRWPRTAPFSWFISSRDHAWHHCDDTSGINFGGNFSIWDKIHGTYHASENLPARIGSTPPENLWEAFWRGAP